MFPFFSSPQPAPRPSGAGLAFTAVLTRGIDRCRSKLQPDGTKSHCRRSLKYWVGFVGGFVVTGNVPKTVLIRGFDPALTRVGLAGALSDPTLTIYQDPKVIATNEGRADSAAITTAAIQTGAFSLPSGSKYAAVLLTLNPGAYTAQIKSGKDAFSGVALIEINEVP